MHTILKNLPNEKIRINWNKNPVKMKDFLGFLTVNVVKSKEHLGACMGWSQYNGDNRLIITGGHLGGAGIELLDHIEYKSRLNNPYNNYVNPFYLFEIFSEEGKEFFLNYYRDNILDELEKQKNQIKATAFQLKSMKEKLVDAKSFLKQINFKTHKAQQKINK